MGLTKSFGLMPYIDDGIYREYWYEDCPVKVDAGLVGASIYFVCNDKNHKYPCYAEFDIKVDNPDLIDIFVKSFAEDMLNFSSVAHSIVPDANGLLHGTDQISGWFGSELVKSGFTVSHDGKGNITAVTNCHILITAGEHMFYSQLILDTVVNWYLLGVKSNSDIKFMKYLK